MLKVKNNPKKQMMRKREKEREKESHITDYNNKNPPTT
jgi:hypothetical protein